MTKRFLCVCWCIMILFMYSVTVYGAEYPGLLRISEVRDSIVVGTDANGNEWTFLDPCEDWEPDDLCGVIYDDMDTPIIYDDEIRQTRYVGYAELYASEGRQ